MALVTLTWMAASSSGQTNNGNIIGNHAVGGVSIDSDGILRARPRRTGRLSKLRGQAMGRSPALNPAVEMREISLRRLEAAIEEVAKANKPLPNAINYLPVYITSATSSSTPSRKTSCWSGRAKDGKSMPRGTSWA